MKSRLLRGVAQFGRVPALGAGCRRFKSCRLDHIYLGREHHVGSLVYGPVAQLGERCVRNAEVKGSNPSRSTRAFCSIGQEAICRCGGMADALASGASVRKDMRVQVPPSAPYEGVAQLVRVPA